MDKDIYDQDSAFFMMSEGDHDVRIGEFLVENQIISEGQLKEALELQNDNKDRLVGEILVTQGVLSKEDLIMAMEMYIMMTNSDTSHVDEWLDQEEVDLLIEKMNNKKDAK